MSPSGTHTPLFEIEQIKYWSCLWFFSTTWTSVVVAKNSLISKMQTNMKGGNKLLLQFKLTALENYEKCLIHHYTFASIDVSLSMLNKKHVPT